ncbi:MAG: hypothetical protein WAO83_24305, partial [Fuerstiella sp.]
KPSFTFQLLMGHLRIPVVAGARQWDTQLLNLSYPEILPSTPREFSCQIASQNRRVPLWHETQA